MNSLNVESELISMAPVWDKKKSKSPTGIKPMTSRTLGEGSIDWAKRTYGVQGQLTEFICDRQSAFF